MNTETTLDYPNLQLKYTFDTAKVYVYEPEKTVVIQTLKSYIPIEQFQEIFESTALAVTQLGLSKLVFDKRELRVFHQPSMEWYFVEWKERMFYKGLRIHRKILPKDPIFVKSVSIGREKIDRQYPDKKFHEMDIQYFDTLNDAILN